MSELYKIATVFLIGIGCGIQLGLYKKHIKAEIKRKRRSALATARWMAIDFRMRLETRKNKERPIVGLLNAHNQTIIYKGNFHQMTEEEFAKAVRNKEEIKK